MRYINRTPKVCVREAEHKELVRIAIRDPAVVLHKVIVVSYPKCVDGPTVGHVGAESQPFDFRWNLRRGDSCRVQRSHNVEEQSLADGVRSSCESVHVADVNRASQIDLEQLLYDCIVSITESVAVAFVD